jgi:GNAT superfamily N-acetyltransferase
MIDRLNQLNGANTEMIIERVTSLDNYGLSRLLALSKSEGYKFVQKLYDEYFDGTNRFNQNGESLFLAKSKDEILGIGGLNIDPYLNDTNIGRVRHLYLLPEWRCKGIGKELLITIIEESRTHFESITLYTDNPIADKLYTNFGFVRAEGIYKASHLWRWQEKNRL